jgi:hypothetical protein
MQTTGISGTRRLVIVEARHLDTDDRQRCEMAVDTQAGVSGQREQLAKVVGQIHPSARLRSFAAGAATFLGPEHLVVARFGEQLADDQTVSPAQEQASLFAA